MIDAVDKKELDLTDLDSPEPLCNHSEARLEKPCCSGSFVECACRGSNEVICDNPNCTGIDDIEASDLFEKLTGGGSYCD